jgi:riboflavin synthase alpha subunit
LPSRNKEKLEKIVYNGSVKLDGLKLTGKKLSETFEMDQSFL